MAEFNQRLTALENQFQMYLDDRDWHESNED